MRYGGHHDRQAAQRIVQAEQLARVKQGQREQMNRLNRPVWTKVNRFELLIAGGVIALIVAWVLYLAFF